jgi:hypothetical protein
MTKVEIYIPGVRRERARKIVLRNIEQDLPTEHGCLSGSNMVRIFSTSLQVMPILRLIPSSELKTCEGEQQPTGSPQEAQG